MRPHEPPDEPGCPYRRPWPPGTHRTPSRRGWGFWGLWAACGYSGSVACTVARLKATLTIPWCRVVVTL